MNLKNSSRLTILFLFIAPFGCKEPKVDEKDLNTIWDLIPAAVEKPIPDGIPKIIFLKKYLGPKQEKEDCSKYLESSQKEQCEKDNKEMEDSGALACASLGPEKIEIYTEDIAQSFKYYQNRENKWMKKEKSAFIHGVIAHEMLHIALWRIGRRQDHHKIMMDERLLEKMLELMVERFGSYDLKLVKELIIEKSLAKGISQDEAEKRRKEREKSLLHLQ